jgi:hypothetical protein
MRIAIINFCFAFVFLSSSLFAQPTKLKWDVSLSYGFAIPVGGFSKFDPEKSLLTTVSGGQSRTGLIGFFKENNSYAKQGQFISLKVTYQFTRHWFASAVAIHSTNAVNTSAFFDYVNSLAFPPLTQLTNEDYRVSGWAVGGGYSFRYRRVSFSVAPLVGQAVIASPSYFFEWFGYPWDWQVIGLTDSPLLGFNGNISISSRRQAYTSLKIDYTTANFGYRINLKTPGLPAPYVKDDVITYRLLSVGITVGYKF